MPHEIETHPKRSFVRPAVGGTKQEDNVVDLMPDNILPASILADVAFDLELECSKSARLTRGAPIPQCPSRWRGTVARGHPPQAAQGSVLKGVLPADRRTGSAGEQLLAPHSVSISCWRCWGY